MKRLLLILFSCILWQTGFGCCKVDVRTVTERLFKGEEQRIFTCRILTVELNPNPVILTEMMNILYGTATAEVTETLFGTIDTKVISLTCWSPLKVGDSCLIYADKESSGFSFGHPCSKWSKRLTNKPELIHELKLIRQFATIFKNKTSGPFTVFGASNDTLATGTFENGKAVGTWKHFKPRGKLSAVYDIDHNSICQYFELSLPVPVAVKSKTGSYSYQSESNDRQAVPYISIVRYETTKVTTHFLYHESGHLQNRYSVEQNTTGPAVDRKEFLTGDYVEQHENGRTMLEGHYENGHRTGIRTWYDSTGTLLAGFNYTNTTGAYVDYYETGRIRMAGQIGNNKRTGIWKYYNEDGTLQREQDFQDGRNSLYPEQYLMILGKKRAVKDP